MTDRLGSMANDELEGRLADLASVLAFPATPDLAAAVGSRLRAAEAGDVAAPASADAGATRPLSIPRQWAVRRSVRRSLWLAAALALLIVGGVFAVRFGLELLSIEFGPIPSATAPTPSASTPSSSVPGAPGAGIGLGRLLNLEEAGAAAPFDVLVPAGLGDPDAVYLGGPSLRGQVALVYAPRDGLPAAPLLGGAGLLVTQNRGAPDRGLAEKLADTGLATVEPVTVNGAHGVWISGRPHIFWYLAPDGFYIEESRRLVGDTLAWERDGILYRIEGAISLEQALDIAGSMR